MGEGRGQGAQKKKKKVHHGKSPEKMVTDRGHSTRLSVQVACNNSTRLIDKPIRRVWVRSVSRIQKHAGFLDCIDRFPLNVRI